MNAGYQGKRRTDDATIYLYAKCEQLIEIYAKSAGLPASELAYRVAELLRGAEGGTVLGTEDRLPALRRNGAGGNQSLEPVALAGETSESRRFLARASSTSTLRYLRPRRLPNGPLSSSVRNSSTC